MTNQEGETFPRVGEGMENLDYEGVAHAIDEKLKGYSAAEVGHVLAKLSSQVRALLLEGFGKVEESKAKDKKYFIQDEKGGPRIY